MLDDLARPTLKISDSAISIDEEALQRPLTTNALAAPEELAGQAIDIRSDLYSLGGLLYILATGDDWPGDPTLLRSNRCDLSTSYADLVESLLAGDPDARPPDADSVLEWLIDIRYMSNIEALIAAGEGNEVEFKASLFHSYQDLPEGLRVRVKQGTISSAEAEAENKKQLRLEVTKTIAAFLNGEGGTVLIGVGDKGEVLGIEPDLPYLNKRDLDSWFLTLKTTVQNALGVEIWACIRVSLVRHGGVTVAVIHCPSRAVATWHNTDKKQIFFARAGNSTEAIEGPALVKYVHERWPKGSE